jgi:crotonobetainyl-CoA:carnitine CoA-transferase CaiB-like acyl-CoA transferase
MFADLGAEVIKVEGPGRPDMVRFGNYPDNEPGDEPWNRGAHFQKFSRNKKSLVLDLNAPAGRNVFLDLIRVSDVFIENNSPRVLPNFGLAYDVLHEANPKLVVISMPGFGNSGAYRDWVAYGINLEAQCGLSSVTGYPDLGPVRSVVPYGDPIAGHHAAVAGLAALRHARLPGKGQYIEVAQNESLLNVLVEPLFRATVGGESPSPAGCHHDRMSPHNVYRARGDGDDWLCLAVEDEQQFRALASVVGHEEWSGDPELLTEAGRKAREGDLDAAIAAWARTRDRDTAASELTAAGVPAAPARRVDEILTDPRLARRGFWVEVDHPVTGRYPYSYLPWRYWRSEPARPAHAPLFGEHNRAVLEGILGMTPEEAAALEAAGVVASRPNMA